ncbi:MAG: glycosyltransferase, partial [Pseudomonadota bacterium]|nr:glycosyltransferase [Pseudomonadota bacterium]
EYADLYIANRGDKLIPLVPRALRRVFWVHNPAQYLFKWRYIKKIWHRKPIIVFIGQYHSSTYPFYAPGGRRRRVIPYGISGDFLSIPKSETPPPPKAIFTSNPLRSLDWLLTVWKKHIFPYVPNAELHLFSGALTYGKIGMEKSNEMSKIMEIAKNLKGAGVIIRKPAPKSTLIEEFKNSRVMLYRGDVNETFCLALGEAQAAGVPAVVQNIGSVAERVRPGVTGAVTSTTKQFAESAIELLTNDVCWSGMHENAQSLQRSWGWPEAAKAFEEIVSV